MKDKIVSVIDKLEKLDIEFDDIALADALWLANEITFLEEEEITAEEGIYSSLTDEDESDTDKDTPTGTDTPEVENLDTKTVTVSQEPKAPLSLEQNSDTTQEILIGKKKDIFISNALIRSLLTFKHKVKSKKRNIVDIERSVEVASQTKLTQLYFKNSYENFLDIYLVIDVSESMEIWQKSLEIFQNKLHQLQGFRNIIPVYLKSDEKKSKLFKDKALTKSFNPHSINSMEKRGLIFVISDMISPAWWSTNALLQLCVLQDKLPLAIVQMLPYNMWQDTILGKTNITTLYSSKFYPKNRQLKSMLDSQLQMIDKDYFKSRILKIPVINLTKSGFLSLGNVWRGKENKKVDGFVIGQKEIYLDRRTNTTELKLTAIERVKLFKRSVSSTAWKLAKYLSVAGRTNVAIMQIIQSEMMSESSQIHLAECFTGGLLDKSKKKEFYQFHDGVDEILKKELGNFFILDTWQKCSDFIADEMGSSLKFNAVVNCDLLNTNNLNENDKIFAHMSVSTLRGLGGKYSQIAEYLENHILKEDTLIEEKLEQTKAIIPQTKRFQMGSKDGDSDEKPVHEVIINYDFEIAQYPVTVGDFRTFVNDEGYITEAELGDGAHIWDGKEWTKKKDAYWDNPYFKQTDNHPVVCISWNDAQEYIKWLNDDNKTEEKYRLPTEAEWEYSARAGTITKWSFGDDEKELEKYAWYNEKGGKGTKPVGEKLPNPWGLFDIHGNVWEWCEDDFVDNYKETPRDGSANKKGEQKYKVLRSGSWDYYANYTRSSVRIWIDPADRNDVRGFRLLRASNNNTIFPERVKDNVVKKISWAEFLKDEEGKIYFKELQNFLNQEEKLGKTIFPPKEYWDNAIKTTELSSVKVVIVGQDPYPTPGYADGLAFSLQSDNIPLPRSLQNIYKELKADLGIYNTYTGNLQSWAEQGVLLLNSILTVEKGVANSHQGRGWEKYTDRIIEIVNEECKNIVFILWGKNAYEKARLIDTNKHFVINSTHPSPLSARRGFFGSKPFSKTNDYLIKHNKEPINWEIKELTYQCKQCSTKYSLNCSDFNRNALDPLDEDVDSEGKFIARYESFYTQVCDKCDNEMNLIFYCSEYPIGIEYDRDFKLTGIKNLINDCCCDLSKNKSYIRKIKRWFFDNYEEANEHEEGLIDTEEAIYKEFEDKYNENILKYVINNINSKHGYNGLIQWKRIQTDKKSSKDEG